MSKPEATDATDATETTPIMPVRPAGSTKDTGSASAATQPTRGRHVLHGCSLAITVVAMAVQATTMGLYGPPKRIVLIQPGRGAFAIWVAIYALVIGAFSAQFRWVAVPNRRRDAVASVALAGSLVGGAVWCCVCRRGGALQAAALLSSALAGVIAMVAAHGGAEGGEGAKRSAKRTKCVLEVATATNASWLLFAAPLGVLLCVSGDDEADAVAALLFTGAFQAALTLVCRTPVCGLVTLWTIAWLLPRLFGDDALRELRALKTVAVVVLVGGVGLVGLGAWRRRPGRARATLGPSLSP
ncbi:hypothetical protein GMRT_13392 [Giardia muris]|uniref:Uncharacterized protein n=1 Tax=Giardia muris TaxID=5742 RepID=A0A4Z1SLG8_GIAMU|nr:hypothetical protein GMRT_13392 [Giardia muris]|eukprot:TNJ26360.1 hypothetical protein GMRT_13392 [Giardia muris]